MNIIEIIIWIASLGLAYYIGSLVQILKYQKDLKGLRKSIIKLREAINNTP